MATPKGNPKWKKIKQPTRNVLWHWLSPDGELLASVTVFTEDPEVTEAYWLAEVWDHRGICVGSRRGKGKPPEDFKIQVEEFVLDEHERRILSAKYMLNRARPKSSTLPKYEEDEDTPEGRAAWYRAMQRAMDTMQQNSNRWRLRAKQYEAKCRKLEKSSGSGGT